MSSGSHRRARGSLVHGDGPRKEICAGGAQTEYFSRFPKQGGRRPCFSDELPLRSACPLGCWLQNPPERTEGTNRKVKKMPRLAGIDAEPRSHKPSHGAQTHPTERPHQRPLLQHWYYYKRHYCRHSSSTTSAHYCRHSSSPALAGKSPCATLGPLVYTRAHLKWGGRIPRQSKTVSKVAAPVVVPSAAVGVLTS